MEFEEHRSLAQQGDLASMYRLGTGYLSGECWKADPVLGQKWLQRASDGGHGDAAFQLGAHQLLHSDRPEESVLHFKRAALLGNSMAQHQMGMIYLGGIFATADVDKALYWLRRAADSGSGMTALILGMLHERGLKGVDQNICKALHWYDLGKQLGMPEGARHSERLQPNIDENCPTIPINADAMRD
ncbi:MAG: sel1 repeat family protein [Rhizobiaceae bacterium]|nr:sel1 repeat family protein [Rhizobiaceae bacterium]